MQDYNPISFGFLFVFVVLSLKHLITLCMYQKYNDFPVTGGQNEIKLDNMLT